MIHLLWFVVGALAGGFIVKNNKDKAFSMLEELHAKAEVELAKLKAKQ